MEGDDAKQVLPLTLLCAQAPDPFFQIWGKASGHPICVRERRFISPRTKQTTLLSAGLGSHGTSVKNCSDMEIPDNGSELQTSEDHCRQKVRASAAQVGGLNLAFPTSVVNTCKGRNDVVFGPSQ